MAANSARAARWTTPKRRYTSTLRADQALLTRQRVLDAAQRQFVAHGYSGATVEAIAADAGVSVQTVYNTVGNKAALLGAAWGAALAGDAAPVPVAQRPEFLAVLDAPDGRTCLVRYAAVSRQLAERALPLAAVILAEAGNPDVRDLAAAAEAQRAQGTAAVAAHVVERFGVRADLGAAEAADVLWTLTGPEIAIRLVRERGWTWDRYEAWLAGTMAHALLVSPAAP
jgi:AcrR family transcriptional regulator